MMPNKNTVFLPIEEISKYTNEKEYFCSAIVFSPETENNHFHDCPPYIKICSSEDFDQEIYFEVPQIVAYYGTVHAGYTMKGKENSVKQGKRDLAFEIKSLLDID